MQQRHTSHDHNIVKGSLLAILTFFLMAVFGVITKVATEQGHYIWVSFITYAVAALCTSLLILPEGRRALTSQHYTLLIARGFIGTIASFLYMIAMHYISTVNATLLLNTAPIFIPIISIMLFHNRVEKSVWCAIALGFIGILVIVKPNKDIITDPGNLIGLASGIALAFAYLFVKLLTATETGLRIIFYYFFIGTLMQLPLLLITGELPTTETIMYAAISGIVMVLVQLCLVRAYLYASASEVGVYQYSSVVFVGIIDWLLWSITPDRYDFIGYVLVIGAGVVIIHAGIQFNKK